MQNATISTQDTAASWQLPPGLLKLAVAGMLIGLLPGLALGAGLGLALTARPAVQLDAQALPVPVAPVAPVSATAAPLAGERQPDVSVDETLRDAQPYARLGRDDAPVKLVVFEDPRCGFCRQLATGAEKAIIDRYVNNGQVQLITRSFDILGPESSEISRAGACAGAAGKYWPFRDQVFGAEPSDKAVSDQIAGWATNAGITETDAFARCLTSDTARVAVDGDNAVGSALGIRGTPTLFVNGRRIVGAVPLAFIEGAIAEALKAQGK